MNIIAYAGKMHSGKSYLMSKKIEELKSDGYSIACISFADTIKAFLANYGLYKSGNKQQYKTNDFNNIIDYLTLMLSFWSMKSDLKQKEKDEIIISSGIKELVYNTIHSSGNEYNDNYRKCLQVLGTDIGRKIYSNIWIDILNQKIEDLVRRIRYIIIDDIRFINEYNALLSLSNIHNVKIYGVISSSENRDNTHQSEIEIDEILKIIPKENIILNERK